MTISPSASIELIDAEGQGRGDPLVLKKALPGASPELITRFETAAQILPRLSTPHVPTLRASGLDEDTPYLLMDRIPGTTLEEVLRRGALPLAELVVYGAALARALHAIHQQQAIHLNVIPSHVMITPKGTVVLLSFGLAHHRECPDLLPAADWARAVTSPWAAPEQLFQVRDDTRSDQWSLGALIYHMAVGHPPFFDPGLPESADALQDRLWKLPVALRALRPDLPAWLQEIVHRCLEVAPSDRFETCGQIAWMLTHPEAVEINPSRARTEPAPVWQRLSRWFQHQRDPVQVFKGLRHPRHRNAPLVVLALDPDLIEGELPVQLREAAARAVGGESYAHLACLTVLARPEGSSEPPGASAACRAAQQALRQWAKPLALPATRLSFHVFEGGDPLDHLLEFAGSNQADLLIIGCSHRERTPARRQRVWPPLMPRVVAEAECSVQVVRPRGDRRREQETID
jgi:nucleotide-binding universal stress UspA family protein